MAKSIPITTENLLSEFYKEYESKNNRFLLFDLANANENANTKVLKNLLQYNNHQFLPSFLKKVGLPAISDFSTIQVTDQKKAIGPKDTGFIDLYIEYDGLSVIIENKIYGAGDTDKQLARYIATVNEVKNVDIDTWYNNPTVNKETHVVYLTADGTKEPSDDSLPENIKKKITYYAINYTDDILPWLKEDVLPNLSYGADGIMIAGMLQYIAFLEQMLSNESSGVVDKFVKTLNLQGTDDVVKYKTLLTAIGENENDKVPENVKKSLRKQLEARAEAIFSGDVDGEWVLHFTPTFILLYKKSWAALDTRKYSIPSLNIYAGSTKYFLDNGCFNKMVLDVDHLSPAMKGNYSGITFGNHDKTANFNLPDSNIERHNVNDPNARKEFYKRVIQQLQPIVNQIDQVVANLQSSGKKIAPNDILDRILSQKIF